MTASVEARDEHHVRRRSHLSARWRLTLWYTALFVVAGAVLLALNYFLVDHSLSQNPDEIRIAVADKLGISPNQVSASEKGEIPDSDDVSVFRDVQRQIADEHLEHLLSESGIALGAMAMVSLGLGWLIAGRVLRPVHRMTTTARMLSESNLHERIALDGPDDELKELADTFDAMLSRLESAFDASGASLPTPRTSSALRSRSFAPKSTSRSPIPMPLPPSCGRWRRRFVTRPNAASS